MTQVTARNAPAYRQEDNEIFIKSLFCALFLCLCSCSWWSEDSFFTDEQADIIRAILNENGYSVDNHEDVDKYVEFGSSSEHVDVNDKYFLLLPEKISKRLVLTDKINNLDNTFMGIKSAQESNYGLVDTLVIRSDSIINVKALNVGFNQIRNLPSTIKYLRGRYFTFNYNELSTLPVELMALTDEPVLYDTIGLNIRGNKIDMSTINPEIKAWLEDIKALY